MNWQLTWASSGRVTGWYAVERLLAGQRPATDWMEDVDGAATELMRPLGRLAWTPSFAGELLRGCMLALSDDDPARASDASDLQASVVSVVQRQAAELSAEWSGGSSSGLSIDVREVTARLIRIAHTFDSRLPRLAQELPLRLGPIREQWEARGPGLMRRLQRLWRDDWRVDAARVALVHPVCGGGGVSLNGSVVAFEAMLCNGTPSLPEILRLGWLLAQLPGLSERSDNDTMSVAFPACEGLAPRQRLALGLLPVVLDAGEYVELTRYDAATLRAALEAWCGYDPSRADELGGVLDVWWQTRRAARVQGPNA